MTLGSALAQERTEPIRIIIMHTNDVHAHYLPFDSRNGPCDEDDECWGGSARVATMVDQVQEGDSNVLLLCVHFYIVFYPQLRLADGL